MGELELVEREQLQRLAQEMKQMQEKVYLDSLTGVFNRRYYDEGCYMAFPEVTNKIGFVIADINNFKYVNDTFGHNRGDELLMEVANKLKSCVRCSDRVIRIGGDEFLVVLRNCKKIFIERKVAQFKHEVAKVTLPRLADFKISIAAGYAFTDKFTGADEQIRQLFEVADERMFVNKKVPTIGQTAECQSISRMSRALISVVGVYTEINVETMRYYQIDLQDTNYFAIDREGEYASAYEYMCREQIHPDDVENYRRYLAPEVIAQIAGDDEGIDEISVYYRLKNALSVIRMESRVIFLRDEIPNYVAVITRDVTAENSVIS
ncbi:MAG: GGDEF domain-containing protein [Lachnospiraceae bacterium]|nr:GGDEF domain-containing protein [Lachnospiraceae bacterium]